MNKNQALQIITKVRNGTPSSKITPHLKPTSYDRWSELHWNAQLEADLTAPEAQELAALESANMQAIMDVYDALYSDADVGEWIERIRGHEWVRVVEGD